MILTFDHITDLLDLYLRCYGPDDDRAACFLRLNHDQLRYRFFQNRTVFGTWHDDRLISTITLRQSKYSNLLVSEGWLADPGCNRVRSKLICYRESQRYAWANGYHVLRVTKTRLLDKVWSINQKFDVGLHAFKVLERIPAGGRSRFAWINERYLWGQPAEEEWTVQLAS